jgi:zinc transport system substrate-binding protein
MNGKVGSAAFSSHHLIGIVWIVIGLIVLPLGCEEGGRDTPPDKTAARDTASPVFTVYTTFYPTTYFTERIGGAKVKVVSPCPPDADPARWMPDDETLKAYQGADLIVVNGAEFEDWIGKVTLPQSRVVNTAAPLKEHFIVLKEKVTHSHGPGGTHTHAGIDEHTWLDPVNAKIQAGEIKSALAAAMPDRRAAFEEGYAGLAKDLDALDGRFKELSAKLEGEFLLCSHPAYNYLGRRYGWKMKYFHLDPEVLPGEAEIREIKTFLETQPAKYMLWEAQPREEIERKFREDLGLQAILFSPCESMDADELAAGKDFLSVMNQNIDRMMAVFGGDE